MSLSLNDGLFYLFGVGSVLAALAVVFVGNPIYSALFLAATMSLLGALFFVLEAYFISVAQITVYAGAVMVLFVMVVMLFDLGRSGEDVFKISPRTFLKIVSVGLLCGFLVGAGWFFNQAESLSSSGTKLLGDPVPSTMSLSRSLFSKYVFAFEAVGLVILVVIVGVVALAKTRGGTHHSELSDPRRG
jgi:NADH-quinone oxidoreductase subunit J